MRERCPWTRSILLTAYVSDELEAEAKSRGVDLVIRKPQSLPDLAQILLHLMGEAQ